MELLHPDVKNSRCSSGIIETSICYIDSCSSLTFYFRADIIVNIYAELLWKHYENSAK